MSRDTKDIEERLKALLAKADALLNKSPLNRSAGGAPSSPAAEPAPEEKFYDLPDLIPNPPLPEPPVTPEPLSLPASVPAPPPTTGEDGVLEIPFLIGYPASLSDAAQKLWEDLESLEPKFTKMIFRLRGRGSIPYVLGQPQFITAFSEAHTLERGVLLLITETPLPTNMSYPFARELARCGFHFQQVSPDAISNKAFYYDFLLGLAFFLTEQNKRRAPCSKF